MQINKINISKISLLKIPDKERTFLIQIGHVSNELSFFNKLLLFVNDEKESEIEKHAMVSQSLMLTRVFIGKVFEAREMLRKDFFGTRISRDIEPILDHEGKRCLKDLKSCFSNRNLISSIRNNYSFHYLSKDFENSLNQFPDDKIFTMYVGKNHANTLNYFSEEIVSVTMLTSIDEKSLNDAMEQLMGDLVKVSGAFITFTSEAILAMFVRHLEEEGHTSETIDIDPDDNLSVDQFKIPFFVRTPNCN